MYRLVIILVAISAASIMAFAGCGNEGSGESSSETTAAPAPAPALAPAPAPDPTPAPPAKAAPPAVGAHVVAGSSSGDYWEGEVKAVSGNTYTIQTQAFVAPYSATVSDVYPLPTPDAPNKVASGDIVVVRTDSREWHLAEVTTVSPGVVGVKLLEGGTTTNVTPEKVVKINPAAAANARPPAAAAPEAAANEAAPEAAAEAPAASGGGGDGAAICERARRCCPAAFSTPGIPPMYANNREQACAAVADASDADFCRTAINGWRQMVSALPGATMPPDCTVE